MSLSIHNSRKKTGSPEDGGNGDRKTAPPAENSAENTGRERVDCGPEAISQLREAFQVFNNASASFTEQYALLEKRIAELNVELEDANARLRENLEEKQKMQTHLSTLLECLPVGVVGVDRRGRVCSLNRCACEILDVDSERASGVSLADLFENAASETGGLKGDSDAGSYLARALEDGFASESTFETEIQPLGGGRRRRVLRLRVVPTDISSSQGIEKKKKNGEDANGQAAAVLLIEDVTDIRRLEQQANRNNRLAAMGEIAINVAHEIRNPLGSIELFASMLQRGLSKDKENGPLAAHICTGVRCLDHIVSNILQFARPQRLICGDVNLEELIEETLLFTEHVLRQKNIRVERHYPGNGADGRREATGGQASGSEDETDAKTGDFRQSSLAAPGSARFEEASLSGTRMWADAELIKQMLLNLFLNAIQATPEEGSLGVQSIPSGETVEIRVWDSGTGIDPEALGKIFDPFFTTRRKGTGLGLTIVHNIVTSHQGTIEAENRAEGGALFSIVLPKRAPRGTRTILGRDPFPRTNEKDPV